MFSFKTILFSHLKIKANDCIRAADNKRYHLQNNELIKEMREKKLMTHELHSFFSVVFAMSCACYRQVAFVPRSTEFYLRDVCVCVQEETKRFE